MKHLVVIPVRGGSKGIPGKNIKMLGGKPLVGYSIDVAREVFPDQLIYISTDDEKIKEVVEKMGLSVPFMRPSELATDTSGSNEVLLHALSQAEKTGYKPDVLVLLQATSPFRTGNQLKEALAIYDDNCDMVASVKITKSNPYYVLKEENMEGWLVKSKAGHFTRRQDCPLVYELNGAIYIINVPRIKEMPLSSFTKIRKYIMDEISSIDIDSPLDWELAELVMSKNINNAQCKNHSSSRH